MYIFPVSDTDKEKLFLGDNIDLGGGGSDTGPSAALTPAIWEKTIPYDGENFHLEYMDLEDFLTENGIPTLPDVECLKSIAEGHSIKTEKAKAPVKVAEPASGSPLGLLPIQDLDGEVVIISKSESDIICDATTGELWRLVDQKLCVFTSQIFGFGHRCCANRICGCTGVICITKIVPVITRV